jgi:hypothetical protein
MLIMTVYSHTISYPSHGQGCSVIFLKDNVDLFQGRPYTIEDEDMERFSNIEAIVFGCR